MRDIRILHYWLHDSGGVKWLNPSYYDNFIGRTNSYSISKTAGDNTKYYFKGFTARHWPTHFFKMAFILTSYFVQSCLFLGLGKNNFSFKACRNRECMTLPWWNWHIYHVTFYETSFTDKLVKLHECSIIYHKCSQSL